VKVALLLRVGGRVLAGEHAHEADVVSPVADHLERFHEAREPIALDAHLFFDLGGGLRRARIFGGSCRLRRRCGGRVALDGAGRALGGRGLAPGSRGLALGSRVLGRSVAGRGLA
jgi:hypothetical protein